MFFGVFLPFLQPRAGAEPPRKVAEEEDPADSGIDVCHGGAIRGTLR
jgi:hypothetical protein